MLHGCSNKPLETVGGSIENALVIVRRARSNASIPLLVKYVHLERSQEITDTLIILTGEDISALLRLANGGKSDPVSSRTKLATTWWFPNKAKITTDPGKMSKEQLQVVIDRQLAVAELGMRDSSSAPSGSAYRISQILESLNRPGLYGRQQTWWPEEVHPAMLPAILAKTGYIPPGAANAAAPAREVYPIPYAAIPMLAALRNYGEAPDLDKIADDKQQNSATRLTCILALHHAGEDLNSQAVLSILENEKKLERRIVAILMLAHSRDKKAVVPKLLQLLDDPNVHIRSAAVHSLRRWAPKEALPQLKKMLEDMEPELDVRTVLSIVGAIPTNEARQTLASFLEVALKDEKKARHVSDALSVFEEATGERWTEAGAHDPAYYRAKTELALDWWKTHK